LQCSSDEQQALVAQWLQRRRRASQVSSVHELPSSHSGTAAATHAPA
jgi:hypothetical protein